MGDYFSAAENDAFTEIFNIGAGQAANALSELLDAPISFSVPFTIVLPYDEAVEYIREKFHDEVCVITQDFSGPFDGAALLMFQGASSLKLAQAVLESDEPLDALTELEREALTEIGNIVLNACLSSFGDLLEREVSTSLPRFAAGASERVLDRAGGDDVVMIVKVDFVVEGRQIEGYVTFILSIESINAFRAAAARLIGGLEGRS